MPRIIEKGKVQVEGDDSFSSIAFHLCGEARRWPEFLKVNPNLRREPMSPAQVGMVLEIPPDWPVQTADQLQLPPPRPLVARDLSGRASVTSPRAESAPAPAAGVTLEDFEKLGSIVRELATWITTADEQIGQLTDNLEILKGMRDADQQRLAEQGARIASLEAKLAASPTSPAPPPAAPIEPTRTGASGGTG
jgi:hypothetical protein